MKSVIFDPSIFIWRNQLNPLVHLTIGRIVSLLQSAQLGYMSELTWLYKFIEKRDAVLRAVKRRKLGSLKKLAWKIKIKEDAKSPDKQEKFLKELYNGIDNVKEAACFLALAEFRGFAHLEKHFTGDGDIFHLEPVPQWFWCRRMPSNDWLYNERAVQTNYGVPIKLKNFVIRECEDSIDEIALIQFWRKTMAQKDWDAFVETYGLPPIFITLPQNTGATPGADGLQKWQETCEAIIGDSRGVLPAGADVKTVDAGSRGMNPFEQHIRYCNEEIVMAATGGLLTTLNDATGMGSGQSEAHENTFHDIAIGEAMDISEIFQRQIDGPELNKAFPDEDVKVYFELESQEIEGTDKVIDDVTKLAVQGWRVDLKQLEEKTGYDLIDAIAEQQKLAAKQQKAQIAAQQPQGDVQTDDPAQDEGDPSAAPGEAGYAGNPYANRSLDAALELVLTVDDGRLLKELERLVNALPEIDQRARLNNRRYLNLRVQKEKLLTAAAK